MRILFTICGRRGSKQVKGKNVRNFLGIPLFGYTYAAIDLFKEETGASWGDFRVGVSSDDHELLRGLSDLPGVHIVPRPEELAGDVTPKFAAIDHCLKAVQAETNSRPDFVMDLDITSPLRTSTDIGAALRGCQNDESLDCVMSAVPARRNPYFNMVKIESGKVAKVIPSNFTARQQAPAMFDLNASIYCYRVESWSVFRTSPLDGKCGLTEMFDPGILDIDSEHDFELMEVIAAHLFRKVEAFGALERRARELFGS